MMIDLLLGLIGSLLIAGAALFKKSLSPSGAAAAVVMGTTIFAAGSLPWYGTLICFFISSSLLSRWKKKKKARAEEAYAKTGRRDAGQVLANGGLALLLCIGGFLAWHPYWWAAFVGAMAAVNADTWATELGGLSRSKPRSIITGKQVEPGTSGGITWLGLAASCAGGLFIGAAAALFSVMVPVTQASEVERFTPAWLVLPMIGLISGLIGSLVDSWIGAVWQRMYRCRVCGAVVEREDHCGQAASRISGWSWMSNDAVNFICSAAGAGTAVLITILIY